MDKVSTFPNIAAIKEEAGVWLVCLDRGELTTQEAQALQEWLGRSQFHQEYLHKLASNWDNMAIMSELAELFPLPDTEMEHRHRVFGMIPRLRQGMGFPLITASTIAAGFLLFIVLFNTTTNHQIPSAPVIADNYYTAIGEQKSFRLQDGSTISLNTNSRVKTDFTGSQRMVRLQQGEANFQVAKNPQRPFVVYVGTGMVWTVGTAFNVRLSSGIVDVTVTDGTVKVFADIDSSESILVLDTDTRPPDNNNMEAVVEAGQTVQYSNVIHTVSPVSSDEMTRKLAWQQNALIFKGEPLEQAIKEMARYTDQQLVIVDPAITGTRIGGHFKTGDIDTLLATLNDGFNIKSEQVAPNLIYLSAK